MSKKSLAAIILVVISLITIVYVAVNWPYSKVTHDVAISGITVSTAQAYRGELVEIRVNVTNRGSVPENFNVSLYLNSTLLETRPIADLGPNAENNLLFDWNTTTATSANYAVKAEAAPVAGETNTTNNVLTDDIVHVRSKPTGLAVVSVNPQNSSAPIGQDFTVNINVSNATDLYGWEFKLGWNSTILQLLNITEGSFLKNTGATFFTYNQNATGPHIIVDCTRLVDLPEASGSGVLATATFHVQQLGSCDLNLYDTVLLDSFEQSMNCTTEGGHFTGGTY